MKRIADTSHEALTSIEPTRAGREAAVLDALARMTRYGPAPTAYELLRFMQAADPTLDLNGVRPRLTALKDGGQVATATKRVCAVTEKRVYTWVTIAPPPALDDTRPAAAQELLF